jgi:hypothetical protein
MLDKSKLYYLSHPFTTYNDPAENQGSAFRIEFQLMNKYEIYVINPILLPLGPGNDRAMEQCRHLYNACDAIILCPDWDKSKGCKEEAYWAYQDNKPRYYVDKDGNRLEGGVEVNSCD